MGRFVYKCPYAGKQCKHHKQCTAIVLAKEPKVDILVRVQCSVIKADTGGKEKELVVTIKAA